MCLGSCQPFYREGDWACCSAYPVSFHEAEQMQAGSIPKPEDFLPRSGNTAPLHLRVNPMGLPEDV